VLNSVTALGIDCFSSCRSLTELCSDSGSRPQQIDDAISPGCSSLRRFEIFNSVHSMNGCFFKGIPLGVIKVEQGPTYFSSVNSLLFDAKQTMLIRSLSESPKLVISKSVQSLYQSCFQSCPLLKEVTFESKSQLRIIGGSAFQGCSSMRAIKFPPSATVLQGGSFRDAFSWKERSSSPIQN